MGISITQLILILVIVFVIFGAGKLPRVMGDVGKGIRSLRDGLKGEDDSSSSTASAKELPKQAETTVEAVKDNEKAS